MKAQNTSYHPVNVGRRELDLPEKCIKYFETFLVTIINISNGADLFMVVVFTGFIESYFMHLTLTPFTYFQPFLHLLPELWYHNSSLLELSLIINSFPHVCYFIYSFDFRKLYRGICFLFW